MNMNTNLLRHHGEMLLPAIAYGDAAGLPVETRSADYISTKHPGGIHHLIPTKENPFYGSTDEPGMWSDDTQLSLAVTRSLIKANGFNMDALVEMHLVAYDETAEIMRDGKLVKRGWGGSTTYAMDKLHDGINPRETGHPEGVGNGVLMKMAALVFWQVAKDTWIDEVYDQYDQLTTMTHNNKVARLTTRVHGDVLAHLLTFGYDRQTFLNLLNDSVQFHEYDTNTEGELSGLFPYLSGSVNKETILEHTDKKGFYAPQTLAMAYGAFMAHDGEFAPSVFEAVNLGGDTDSMGSIVGTMSVFSGRDKVELPADHVAIEQLTMLQDTSGLLARLALL